MYGLEVHPFKRTDAFEICREDFGTRVDYIILLRKWYISLPRLKPDSLQRTYTGTYRI